MCLFFDNNDWNVNRCTCLIDNNDWNINRCACLIDNKGVIIIGKWVQ